VAVVAAITKQAPAEVGHLVVVAGEERVMETEVSRATVRLLSLEEVAGIDSHGASTKV
jgi:hypothetical protein